MPLYKIYFQDGSTFDGGNSIHESRWLEIPDRSIARLEYFFTEGEGIILQGFESYLCFVEAEATISRPVGNCPKCGLNFGSISGSTNAGITASGSSYVTQKGYIGGRFRKQSLRPGARKGRVHAGIDINAPKGTPIYAPAPGKVVHVGSGKGIGKNVQIEHPSEYGGVTTWYGHLEGANVKVGDVVKAGQQIATIGTSTGKEKETSPHLHMEVLKPGRKHARPPARLEYFEERVDPEKWLSDIGAGTIASPTQHSSGKKKRLAGTDIQVSSW